MPRNLVTQTIRRFRGLNVWSSFVNTTPDQATDLLNVVPSSSGGLEKLRVPVTLSTAIAGQGRGPDTFFQFQTSAGIRQVFAQFGALLGRYGIDWTWASIETDARNAQGLYSYVTANNLLFAANGFAAFKWNGTATQVWGIQAPAAAPTLGATLAGALTFTNGGRRYRISYGNSATGHVSNASSVSLATGNLVTQRQFVTGPAPTDPQVDQAWLWSTVDGGGDYYLNQTIAIASLGAVSFTDNTTDAALTTSLLAPLINDLPPIGKYVVRWSGRVFVLNLTDDPQGIAYSGYERILVGRPEESFPPNNRLRLAIGADDIRGAGAVANGLVLFSRSNEMFMLRGTLQDVTVDAPIQLSAFLQPLPFSQGCFSHFSIAETPEGLVWLASDKTIQIYDGSQAPQCLSTAFHPILRRITSGTEDKTRGCFFNYLEREWYALTCAIDGSYTNNLIVIVDLDPNPQTNVGAFLSNLEAAAIGVVEDAVGTRQLMIAQSGLMKQFMALSDTVNGISNPITSTSGTLGGYWLSGVFGNEGPSQMKLFRWAHVVTDQNGFRVQVRMFGETDNLRYPQLIDFAAVPVNGRLSINAKGRRLQHEIRFPDQDVSANVLELSNSYIPLSER